MKNLSTTAATLCLFISGVAAAQTSGVTMKKHADQLPQGVRGDVHVAYQGKSIDRMIYEFMEEEGIPGMTLAIVQAPYIPRVVGYGVTDVEQGKLAAAKTLWPVGPISQAYTAVAVMQLYERGKLQLTDPVGKYVKSLPATWQNITIKQLLQHASGIADYRGHKDFSPSKESTPEQLIASVADQPLAFAPGTYVQQSATNFLLLTSVIEKVSRMSYHAFVKKYQIEYLGLTQTFFAEDLAKVKQENLLEQNNLHELFKRDKDYINPSETSSGYVEKDGLLVKTEPVHPSAFKGFADVYASAENVSHWDIALAGSVLIADPENRKLVYGPTTLDNGKVVPAMAGWQFYAHKGLMDIKGDTPGHSAFLSRFTDASELVCVTLLANKEGVELTNLARRIAASFDSGKMGTGANDHTLYTYESQFSVDETVSRIEAGLQEMGIPVFAKFDHAKNAQETGLELRANQVIVFGSPKVGTKLMQQNPSIAIELPLRINVYEDAQGSVWATFPQMKIKAAEYGMQDNPVIAAMQKLLERIVVKGGSVY